MNSGDFNHLPEYVCEFSVPGNKKPQPSKRLGFKKSKRRNVFIPVNTFPRRFQASSTWQVSWLSRSLIVFPQHLWCRSDVIDQRWNLTFCEIEITVAGQLPNILPTTVKELRNSLFIPGIAYRDTKSFQVKERIILNQNQYIKVSNKCQEG